MSGASWYQPSGNGMIFVLAFFCVLAALVAWRASRERRRTPLEGGLGQLKLSSPAFEFGEDIPRKYSGEMNDESPPLRWSGVPDGTREFVLICEDLDSSQPEPFVHWLVYNISPTVTALPNAMQPRERLELPVRADQGRNSFGKIGYSGPMPPIGHGWHRYYFRLFALDIETGVRPGAEKQELLKAIEGHVLSEAKIFGRYRREAKAKRRAA